MLLHVSRPDTNTHMSTSERTPDKTINTSSNLMLFSNKNYICLFLKFSKHVNFYFFICFLFFQVKERRLFKLWRSTTWQELFINEILI